MQKEIPISKKMNLQPTLENELILLRPLRESDFEPLYEVAKDPLIWEQHPYPDRYKKDEFSKFFHDSLKSNGALVVIDKSKNRIIGCTRFKPIQDVENAIEIGWSFLSRNCWGGRYNMAVKLLMIDHALESVDDIIFYVDKNNIRSQRAVEKIGGYGISESQFGHLMKNSESDLTYRIGKKDWIIKSSKGLNRSR